MQYIEKTNEILETRLRKVELTVTPQKITSKLSTNHPALNVQSVRINSDRQMLDDNAPTDIMSASLSSTIESTTDNSANTKPGIFPLFDQETFTKHSRKGRNKSGSRHSSTARFIKGDRKVSTNRNTTTKFELQKRLQLTFKYILLIF